MRSWIPEPGSKLRAGLIGVAAFGGILLLTRVLPAQGRAGTPPAILFQGLVLGLVSALVAAGIILIYRTTRIINFAQAAIGGAGGAFTYHLMASEVTSWPFIPSFLVGIAVAAAVGAIIEVAFVRRFFNAPRLVLTVLSIALLPALGFSSGFVQGLPIFGDPSERDASEILGTAAVDLPFKDFEFFVGDLQIPFGFRHVFAIVISVASLMALGAFLRYTRAGIATRAAAENQERALLLGINVRGLSTIVWSITGALSGVGVIATALNTSFQTLAGGVVGAASGTLLVALGAAVLGKMKSLPIAVASAIGFEIFKEGLRYGSEEGQAIFNLIVFVVILGGLIIQRKDMLRSESGSTSSWEATKEFRPTPKEMIAIPGIRLWRYVLVLVGLAAVLIFPWAASTGATNLGGFMAIIGICMVSLVVLTGWTGQVSLGQFALVGLGAAVAGGLIAKAEISFWLTLPIVTAFTGGFALLVGIPALRIKGLFLAVTTFAFAFVVEGMLFQEKFFGWLIPKSVERPRLFLVDFDDERSMYYLCVVALVLAITLVSLLRRSRPGRVMIAVRENEANAQSFGVNIVRMKLAAFAFSGSLCGAAGVLLAVHQRAIVDSTFTAQQSLNIFIFTVIGGIGSVSGAVFGSIYFALNELFGNNPLAALVVGPVGLLVLLYAAPGGLSSIAYGLRDGLLRIVAQRRKMVVPSLFEDIDPAAMERQLAPLAEPMSGTGMGSLPKGRKYRSTSELYSIRGRGVNDRERAPDEKAFIGAAVSSLESSGAEEPGRQAPVGKDDE